MRFKIISSQLLRECLSNLLTKNYDKSYEDFRKFAKLRISKMEFEKYKKRGITEEEMVKILNKTAINAEGEVERIKNIWDNKEGEIIDAINERTGVGINTEKITCYVDPYQNGGYYGEDNITVGIYNNPEEVLFVIAHELFHIFYWRKLAKLKITKSVMGKEEPFEWQLAESTDHLLTIEPKIRVFWKNIKIDPYPEIEKMLTKIEKIWKEKPFQDFLIESYILFRR